MRTNCIFLSLTIQIVILSINLNNQFIIQTCKICNISVNDMLPAELIRLYPPRRRL